jgi:ankyrin repeat protein
MTDNFVLQQLNAQLLHGMARKDAESAKIALECGADPNAKDEHKRNMLSLAAEWGYAEIAQMLIDKGAKIDVGDGSAEMTPLMHAAFRGHADVVRLLLAHGAEVNRICSSGDTALTFSVYHKGSAEAVRLLVENGADLKHKNAGGMTSLEMAETFQHEEIVDLLKKAPAIQEALRIEAGHEVVVKKQEYLKQRAQRHKLKSGMRP